MLGDKAETDVSSPQDLDQGHERVQIPQTRHSDADGVDHRGAMTLQDL